MTPSQQRPHIGLFGRTNTGKSTLLNALAGQNIAITSPLAGTTTDSVKKTMELPGIGPVVLIDTAGFNDTGPLGEQRLQATQNELPKMDAAVLVFAHRQFDSIETDWIQTAEKLHLPYLLFYNEFNGEPLSPQLQAAVTARTPAPCPAFNLQNPPPWGMPALLSALQKTLPPIRKSNLFEGRIKAGDAVLLVTPIDEAAPEGRLILPQVQTLRDLLDCHALITLLQPDELPLWLQHRPQRPRLTVTDSQAFSAVDALLPGDWELTGFSVLLAQHQGPFDRYLADTPSIDRLQNGDTVLILESCTHKATCNDIATVKLPRLLQAKTGKSLRFEWISGLDPLPADPTAYAFVIQCGGCMITPTQLNRRLLPFIEARIPVSNFGMSLAFCSGIFDKATHFFRSPLDRPSKLCDNEI